MALLLLIDLVVLEMVLFGKSLVPRGSFAFCDFHTITAVCDATISFRFRRPAFSRTHFVDTISFRLVFVMVRATDLIARLIFSVARLAARSSKAILKGIAAGAAAIIFPITRPFANNLSMLGGTLKLSL